MGEDEGPSSTATMAQIRYNPLSLPRLSGTCPTPKSEASFKVWQYQLEAVQIEENLTENQLKQIIRRSLCGEAAEVIVSLPVSTSAEDIIQALADNYGVDSEKIDGWAKFHSATQKSQETATEWKMRLLSLYAEADPKNTFQAHKNKLLITAFWTNLYNKELRMATPTERKTCGDFGEFFRAVKAEEPLYAQPSVKPAKATNEISEMTKLKKQMEELRLQNEKLQKQLNEQKQYDTPRQYPRNIMCFACGEHGHIASKCSNRLGNDNRQGQGDKPSPERR